MFIVVFWVLTPWVVTQKTPIHNEMVVNVEDQRPFEFCIRAVNIKHVARMGNMKNDYFSWNAW
jgi:hypothetical protein